MSQPGLFDPDSLAPPHRTRRARLRELLTTAVVITAGVAAFGENEPPSVKVSRLAAAALKRLDAGGPFERLTILGDLLPTLDTIDPALPWMQDAVWADLRAFT